MKRLLVIGFSSLLVLVVASLAFAAEDPMKKTVQGALETAIEGCEEELSTYCKNVTPGEGRLLACLYAYQDKLSPRCEYSLYDSAAQLDRALNALTYVAQECGDDLQKYCADTDPGEGRLRDCLKRNEAKVSERCKTALKDVGQK
ncbi:MAG: cysteine rich repeat-containing protein [Syntrophotaleaceae bacterium]